MAQSKFVIYNYNFARIIEPNEQLQIEFPEWTGVNVEESFAKKQELLDEVLLKDFEAPYQFENPRKKPYWHKQITRPEDSVYVMRVANITNVIITDADLKDREFKDYRNCLVIIDNRPGMQRIAIERKTKAFSDTKTVAGILESTLCRLLQHKLLKVKLSAVYSSSVFWTTVNDYPLGFRRIRIHFPHLNLERVTKFVDKCVTLTRKEWNSDCEISLSANEGGVVKIDPDNEHQRALVESASAAGVYIQMYPIKNKRKIVYCGKDQFVVQEIDENVFEALVSDIQLGMKDMATTPMDKIKLFMNNIPDVF